ncbi:hypothetical protein ACQR1I_03995 [Bradyrhizobium sp. HKCCYLS2038]|uniref:hypothetical protein n=1 Tax=unclassified Bradyrhizobium TaxID=2631580 RepID=UPI003EBA21B9
MRLLLPAIFCLLATTAAAEGRFSGYAMTMETHDRCIRENALRGLASPIVCRLAKTAATKGPFTPPGVIPPDYAMTMATHEWYGKGRQITLHHGDWTRAAVTAELSLSADSGYGAVAYYLTNVGTILVDSPGRSFSRGPYRSSDTKYAPRNTGERQTHLGETCTVWEVSRTTGDIPVHLSCVSDDGIELWQKSLSSSTREVISSAEATQIERRPVSPEDACPPSSVFAPSWPDERDTLPPIAPEKSDYEVVLEQTVSPPGKEGSVIRTVRRHGPWEFTKETTGKLRTIHVIHDFGQVRSTYETDDSGARQSLWIDIRVPTSAEQERIDAHFWAALPRPLIPDRTDTVLGENCRWFDMMPVIAGGRTSSCLTKDGIALKERQFLGHLPYLGVDRDPHYAASRHNGRDQAACRTAVAENVGCRVDLRCRKRSATKPTP